MKIKNFPKSLFLFAFCFLFPMVLFCEKVALFSPPQGWECAAHKPSSQHIAISFIGSGKNHFFRPSINFATEDVDSSLKEYVQAVKKIHLADPSIHLRDLGETSCKMGNAHLLELTSQTPYGEVHMLQFISLCEHKAYLLTGAVLKEEYMNVYPLFLQSFHTLILVDNLTSSLPQMEKQMLEKKLAELRNFSLKELPNKWKSFQSYVVQNCKDEGAYWQYLFLKKNYEDLQKQISSDKKS